MVYSIGVFILAFFAPKVCFPLPALLPTGAKQVEDFTSDDRKGQGIHHRERTKAAGQIFNFENQVTHSSKVPFSHAANNGVNTP